MLSNVGMCRPHGTRCSCLELPHTEEGNLSVLESHGKRTPASESRKNLTREHQAQILPPRSADAIIITSVRSSVKITIVKAISIVEICQSAS